MTYSREKALETFKAYNDSHALYTHALAVEAVMGYFARHFQEDAEYWGLVGLLHDVDYQRWPQEHCKMAPQLLSEAGYDESFIHSVVSHGYGLCSDVQPLHIMEKTLYAIDELTGLVAAAALMRPSKSVLDLEVSSVKKKFKDKRFAAGVNREVILNGCQIMGLELEAVMDGVICAMRGVAEQIGLKGEL